MIGISIFISVLIVSFIGVALYRRLGLKTNILAIPNERSSHSEPTPHGAGIVIVILCLLAYVPISLYVVGPFSWGYFIGAVLIALISFLDDIKTVPFFARLFIHSLAAVLLMMDLDTWHGITMLGGIQLGWFGYVLTFMWIVWMVNSYNFMDGIDGLAGLQAVIAAAGWLILCRILDMQSIYYFGCVIGGASLGFLIQNLSKSKIFMGDVGSAFLGFTFAALPLLGRNLASKYPDLLPIAAVLLVWFFLFDSIVTILRRLLRGEKIWVAHREHLFQRLVKSGYSHREVTMIYGILATLLSITVLLSVQYREDISFAIAPVVILLTGVLLFICYRRSALN